MKTVALALLGSSLLIASTHSIATPELSDTYLAKKYEQTLPAIALVTMIGMGAAKSFSGRLLALIAWGGGGLYLRKEFHDNYLVEKRLSHRSETITYQGQAYFNHCNETCATLHTRQERPVAAKTAADTGLFKKRSFDSTI